MKSWLTRILIIIILFIMILIFVIMTKKTDEVVTGTALFELPEYQKISKGSIKRIEVIKYTEAGSDRKSYQEEDVINRIYDNLNKIKVMKKTNSACDDNTTIYLFTLNTEEEISIEIECDWLVLNQTRYYIKKE